MRPRTAIAVFGVLVIGLLAPAAALGQEPAPAPAPAPEPQPLDVAAPSRAHGSTVAQVVAPTFARARIKSRKRGWRVRTATAWSGQPQVLLVLDAATVDGRDWVKLLLADRPNGSAGWVPRDRVALARTRYWVTIRVRARRVTVHRNGNRVRRFRAVVGAPRTPTPRGLAAIYERNRQPDPGAFLGPWALSLTSLSNVLKSFGGGPGRVAIHGRAGASLKDPLGSARSHGCIRVNNDDIRWMAEHISAGTPVRITR
jgi:lipoprotein-anchoring transpeptidase ErfK/SrfK